MCLKTRNKTQEEAELFEKSRDGSLNMTALHGKAWGWFHTVGPFTHTFSLVLSCCPCQRPSHQLVSCTHWRSSRTGSLFFGLVVEESKSSLSSSQSSSFLLGPLWRPLPRSRLPGLFSCEGQDRWRQMSLVSEAQYINNTWSRPSCINEINLKGVNTVLRWITDHTRGCFCLWGWAVL